MFADNRFLGVQPNIAESGANGIVLRGVRPDSPASKAGLQTGDVILKIGDVRVDGYQSLVDVVTASKAGDKLILTIKRGEEELALEVELGEPRR